MDTRGKEFFLDAMKNNNYDYKVATSIFITIADRVKFELYPLIEREIGKNRKKFFIPQYPNEFEKNEIIKLLMLIPFTFAIRHTLNFRTIEEADKINVHIIGFLNNLEVSLEDFKIIEDMYQNDENYLQKISSDICYVINWLDPVLSFNLMVILSGYYPLIETLPVETILSCDEQDLIPTVYELCGW